MMDFEILRVVIAVVLTAIAAWQDNKTSYVDDKVLYALVGAGLLLNVLSFNVSFFISTLPAALFIVAFGYLLWRRGSFGQGDVWLFLGLQLLLPEYPSFVQSPLPNFPFVASVFLASSVSRFSAPARFMRQSWRRQRLSTNCVPPRSWFWALRPLSSFPSSPFPRWRNCFFRCS